MEWYKSGNTQRFRIGTKEFLSLILLIVFIVIVIKPEILSTLIYMIRDLINTPGFDDLVETITTIVSAR